MISAIIVKDPSNTPIKWWNDVEWLKGRKKIEFKPGLNILFGPNGSGKSTVLSAIAQMLMCEQGGDQVVTGEALRAIWDNLANDYKGQPKNGLRIDHDGSPVHYCNPTKAIGLFGGAFDDDFFLEGVHNSIFKGSEGQTTLRRIDKALAYAMDPGKYPMPAVSWKQKPHDAAKLAFVEGLFKAKKGTKVVGPTILMDEPTKSLALPYESNFWRKVPVFAARSNIQIIVATHSPFALLVPGAHFIETKPGYVDECTLGVLEYFKVPQ